MPDRPSHLRIISPQPTGPVVSSRFVQTLPSPALAKLYARIFADVLPDALKDKQAG